LLQQFLRLILVDLHSFTVLIEEKNGSLAVSAARRSITGILFTARQQSIPGGRSRRSRRCHANQFLTWSSANLASPLARRLPYPCSARAKSCRRAGYGRFLGSHWTW